MGPGLVYATQGKRGRCLAVELGGSGKLAPDCHRLEDHPGDA